MQYAYEKILEVRYRPHNNAQSNDAVDNDTHSPYVSDNTCNTSPLATEVDLANSPAIDVCPS